MLKMKKVFVIVTMILVVGLLGVMSLEANATGLDIDNPVNLTGNLDIITGGDDLNSTNSTNNTTTLLPENNTTNESTNNTASVIQPEVDNNNTNSSENTLPKTGVTEDVTVMFFIIVCVVSAIYAYKKIRDYNV